MVLRLEGKKEIVAEVAELAKRSQSIVAAEYAGLKVEQITDLRAKSRKVNVTLKVVRNTLAIRAFADTPYAGMKTALKGPLILAFSHDDPGAAARLFRDFGKEHEFLKVQALALESTILPASSLNAVASLPTYDQAISQLMSVMLAPATKLVRTMAETYGKLVRTVAAVRDQKKGE